MSIQLSCFHCHKDLVLSPPIGRREECGFCGSDVHVCKNCEHYDPRAYNECRETSADVVREKDRANFCDYFSPRKGKGAEMDKAAALKAAAEALFKKR